ncbi:MAG: succinylglutamate desuccinylase/aspartoacylase family protein [Planctomycetaceae bacterium]|nr:succinylglutamate desuccinylase/aspartoacylase family protein [Planctomycetaceae bacterium]
MSRTIVNPDQVDFETRGRRDYHVKLEHTTIWAHHLIPVTVLVGPDVRKGRGLVAIGSTHGDELEGPVAIKHLLHEIRTEDVLGRIILIPVLNPMAFKANRRETPDDGVNLNRAFPGCATGSVTSRLADFVTRFIFPQVHVVLDIHAGGEVARFPATANVHYMTDPAQRKAMEETARGFGTKFIMQYQNQTPGLLTGLAEDLGKISVGTEMGWGRAVQVGGVSMSRQGVLTAAVRQGQLRGDLPPSRNYPASEQVLVDTSHPASNLLAAFEGHFEPTVELGQKVASGQRIGWLHDFNRLDDPPQELLAPHDGYIICQAWGAKVIQGQVLTQVGRPLEWAR